MLSQSLPCCCLRFAFPSSPATPPGLDPILFPEGGNLCLCCNKGNYSFFLVCRRDGTFQREDVQNLPPSIRSSLSGECSRTAGTACENYSFFKARLIFYPLWCFLHITFVLDRLGSYPNRCYKLSFKVASPLFLRLCCYLVANARGKSGLQSVSVKIFKTLNNSWLRDKSLNFGRVWNTWLRQNLFRIDTP